MRTLSKHDIEFLNDLQLQMLTQDTVCQASPRYWAVAQYRQYPAHEDYADSSYLVDDEGNVIGENLGEVIKKLLEDHDEILQESDFQNCSDNDLSDVINVLTELGIREYKEVYYSNVHEVERNSFFLTLEECKKHIELNRHHYNDTVHSYAMTAWRSPQVEKLYEILENVDFSKLIEEGESDELL